MSQRQKENFEYSELNNFFFCHKHFWQIYTGFFIISAAYLQSDLGHIDLEQTKHSVRYVYTSSSIHCMHMYIVHNLNSNTDILKSTIPPLS